MVLNYKQDSLFLPRFDGSLEISSVHNCLPIYIRHTYKIWKYSWPYEHKDSTLFIYRFPFRNEEDELSVEESDRSSLSAKTPQRQTDDFTTAAPTNKPEKDFNATYSLNSSKPEELTKSFLGDLPPLGASSGPKNSSLSLAPLKRIPPVAKVEATKKEGKNATSNCKKK